MASKKRRRKKTNSSAAYPVVLAMLAVVIVILLIITAAAGSCSGSEKDETDTSPQESANSTPAESQSASAPEETSAVNAVVKIKYNAEEDWALYVIGNKNPLPENFTVETKTVTGERTLDSRCADYAIQMLDAAAEQNVGLFVTSSYRSVQRQAENMESYINTLISQGYSQDEAKIQAEKEIALPGRSEHNAGLAMDIVSSDYWSTHDDLDESFEKLPQFDWLIANSWKYGFVLSYPKGKEDITGIIYEPWHYRFVGLKHAEKMHEVYESTGEFLTVNEYIEQYIDME
ncbi:MAG: M15 family metallopeptidase [Ruminococcaceae bacterium]|nr:M15 family metallopeptidase [Oscillospiraceae bacterium]